MNICFLIHQIGHYHHARFDYLGKHCELEIIEIFPASDEYGWTDEFKSDVYKKHQRTEQNDIKSLLTAIKPDKIYTCGWSSKYYFQALKWGKKNKIPVWGISDSRYEDKKRRWLVEKIKGLLVKRFDGFLVAGTQSRNYLQYLGFKKEIQQPWDVVDNDYFSKALNLEEPLEYLELNLPDKFILYNARYIAKKNHFAFIEAYNKISAKNENTLPVVMIGNGKLKQAIIDKLTEYGLKQKVQVLDFVQYNILPYFYKNAHFLILPSSSDQWGLVINEALASKTPVVVSANCGATLDLIKDGENGFIIQPNELEILNGLNKIQHLSEEKYTLMCNNCSKNINNFTLDSFKEAVLL